MCSGAKTAVYILSDIFQPFGGSAVLGCQTELDNDTALQLHGHSGQKQCQCVAGGCADSHSVIFDYVLLLLMIMMTMLLMIMSLMTKT